MKHYNHKRVINGGWHKVSVGSLLPQDGNSFDLFNDLRSHSSKGRFYWPVINVSPFNNSIGSTLYIYFEKADDAVWYRLKYGHG